MENKYSKVIEITSNQIKFDCGRTLFSSSDISYLNFNNLSIKDFHKLEFDLSQFDKCFRRIEGYGIELIPVKGFSIKIEGYLNDDPYYSAPLFLFLQNQNVVEKIDISECGLHCA